MDKVDYAQDSAYYDFNGLNNLRSAKSDDKAALKAAAKKFESIFTQMLLSSMRKASEVLESDSPFNSQSTKFYRDMYDKQLVSNMVQTGGLGLADMIVEQLSGDNPNFKPASVLRNGSEFGGKEQTHSIDLKSKEGLAFKHNEAVAMHKPAVKTASTSNDDEQKTSLFDSPMGFVKSLLPVAKKVLQNSPISPVMLVAQAALETGWGKKVINKSDGSSSFNLFGIKADDRWDGEKAKVQTLEFKGGVAKKESAFFRAYQSLEHSLRDYLDFISSDKRYSEAMSNAGDPAKYFQSLQSAGYATDPNYADKIVKILNSGVINDAKE